MRVESGTVQRSGVLHTVREPRSIVRGLYLSLGLGCFVGYGYAGYIANEESSNYGLVVNW